MKLANVHINVIKNIVYNECSKQEPIKTLYNTGGYTGTNINLEQKT
jgi:hypothetical protein